jgi:hypothetical protein
VEVRSTGGAFTEPKQLAQFTMSLQAAGALSKLRESVPANIQISRADKFFLQCSLK